MGLAAPPQPPADSSGAGELGYSTHPPAIEPTLICPLVYLPPVESLLIVLCLHDQLFFPHLQVSLAPATAQQEYLVPCGLFLSSLCAWTLTLLWLWAKYGHLHTVLKAHGYSAPWYLKWICSKNPLIFKLANAQSPYVK